MDDNDLELFARDHLSYEVWMLGETAQWLITVPPSATLATRNAYLESFGIHARTLGAFLANSGTHAEDVLAEHYSSNWPGEDPVPGLARIVNKQVAHLTAVRLEKSPINPWDAHERLIDSFRRLIGTVPEPRQQWFDWFC